MTISVKFNLPNVANKISVSTNYVSYFHERVLESIYLSSSTEEETLKILINLKNSTSGWDMGIRL